MFRTIYEFAQSRDCAAHSQNLETAQPILRLHNCVSAIHERNGMRASKLTNRRGLRALRVGEGLNGGTPQVWGLPVPYPDKGEGSFSKLVNFLEVPGVGGLNTCPMLMVMTELQKLFKYVPYLNT